LTNIKQAQKQAMSGNYLCVTMFGVLFSVTKNGENAEKGQQEFSSSKCILYTNEFSIGSN